MPKSKTLNTRTVVTLGLLVAINIILSRILAINVTTSIRISLGNVPLVLSGLLFGPLAGALTGFVSDFIGANLLGSGWNPMLMVSPILMGLLPGLLRFTLKNKVTYWNLVRVAALPYILGSMLWTTFILHILYGSPLLPLLAVRIPVNTATMLMDTGVIYLLDRSGMFRSLGLSFNGGKNNELRRDT